MEGGGVLFDLCAVPLSNLAASGVLIAGPSGHAEGASLCLGPLGLGPRTPADSDDQTVASTGPVRVGSVLSLGAAEISTMGIVANDSSSLFAGSTGRRLYAGLHVGQGAAAVEAGAGAAPKLVVTGMQSGLEVGLEVQGGSVAGALTYGQSGSDDTVWTELSASRDLRGVTRFSFYESMIINRKVVNPLEPAHVKSIHNLVEFGLSYTLQKDAKAELELVGGWQVNRGLMVKGKASRSSVDFACLLRTWSSVASTVALGVSVPVGARGGDAIRYGLSVTLERAKEANAIFDDTSKAVATPVAKTRVQKVQQ